jgi:hypothetical protein
LLSAENRYVSGDRLHEGFDEFACEVALARYPTPMQSTHGA